MISIISVILLVTGTFLVLMRREKEAVKVRTKEYLRKMRDGK